MPQENKMVKCKDCFWNDVSAQNWKDFECKLGINKEERIQAIKTMKCEECRRGQDNYSQVWACESCGVRIDGHQYFWHASLCENCWFSGLNKENIKKP